MRFNPNKIKKKLLASGISSAILANAGITLAQDDREVEEVIIRGVKGSQISAINTKRNADSVVDGIVAEDIGKLPDVTIADSLQRISGIQIQRSAGEGGALNVRGLPQVVTQLNGEQYLGSSSVVSVQPDFGDIPSQLFKGADVYKSPTANLGATGITGTVNLKTHRPFDMDEGFTGAASLELQTGVETSETDPVISGLANWKAERWGVMVAGSWANVNLSNSYNGVNGAIGDYGWTGQVDSVGIIDGWNDPNFPTGRNFMSMQGIAAWNLVTERERLGLNGSFQADLGEGFEFIADWFYTSQDEYNRKIGLSATDKWQSWNWFRPTNSQATGADAGDGREWYTWDRADLSPKRLKSFTENDVYFNHSSNVNLELKYDNGGKLTASTRIVMGNANERFRHGYNEGDITDGTSTGINPFYPSSVCDEFGVATDQREGDQGGCYLSTNPLGYSEDPLLTYDTSGEHPTWGGFDNVVDGGLGERPIRDYMANLDSYNVGAFSSENNTDADGSLDIFRTDASYEFDDDTPFFTSVDLGFRMSQRSTEFERYNLFSPFYENGCEAQWKATDVHLEAGPCQEGEQVANPNAGDPILDDDGDPVLDDNGDPTFESATFFEGYTVLPPTRLDQYNNAIWVTDFGPVNGIPGVWAVDPHDYDNAEAFHNRVFGSTVKRVIPGSSFNVDLDETSYYVQGNFEKGIVTGNIGFRVIDTTLTVKQNQAGPALAYGNTNTDVGDILTKRDYQDVLPAINTAIDFTDDLKLRLAYAKTMTPLDLDQYGDGLVLNTTIDSQAGSPTEGQFIVSGGSLNGNPKLNPWRADNYDASLEWYTGEASILSIGLFRIEIESFTQASSELQPQPDADGVVRRQVPITLQVQGEGGSLEGIELGAKIAFSDFTDAAIISDFGIDTNYTHSPSEGQGLDVNGDTNKFPDNSENQFNLVGWYQNDKFQARIAYNYRSERLANLAQAAWGSLNVYQSPTTYIDISASYDITDEISIYLTGSNVTDEFEDYYVEWEKQFGHQNFYEARYALGVRARF